jgi:hypothetical protein
MEGSVLSFLKAEWKVSNTGSTHWASSYYLLANEVAKGYSNATIRPSVLLQHPCEHSRINILQWILTKLGTYLVLERIWNPLDFHGQRSRSLGQIFRRGDTPRIALPLFILSQKPCKLKKKKIVSYFYKYFCHKIVFTHFVQDEVVVLSDRSILWYCNYYLVVKTCWNDLI